MRGVDYSSPGLTNSLTADRKISSFKKSIIYKIPSYLTSQPSEILMLIINDNTFCTDLVNSYL